MSFHERCEHILFFDIHLNAHLIEKKVDKI